MKRNCLVILLALAGLLSACAAAREDARPETGELALLLEGTEERVPVKLWQGEGFSVYLPAEGWAQDEEDIWRPEKEPEAAFFVRTYEKTGGQELWQQLAQDFASYGFLPPEDDVCVGYDAVNAMTMWVRLTEEDGVCYAVCAQYPTESSGEYGDCLQRLAETFEADTAAKS